MGDGDKYNDCNAAALKLYTLGSTLRVLSPGAPLLELLCALRLVSSLHQSRLPQSFVIGLFKYGLLYLILFSNSLN